LDDHSPSLHDVFVAYVIVEVTTGACDFFTQRVIVHDTYVMFIVAYITLI
jgi:hypothetical protein